MKPTDLKHILDEHDEFWEDQRQELVRFKAVYEMDFWEEESADKTQIRIQTNDGYGYIEGYQASLFARNPAVVVKTGVSGKGDPEKAKGVANYFLGKSRSVIEGASRMALIYPNSFIKYVPREADNVYDKVIPVAVPPWEVIVDRDAVRWDLQRYVAHIYWLSVPKANERFKRRKSFADMATDMESYFDEDKEAKENYDRDRAAPKSDMFRHIKIVEMYDLLEDKLYWWSPAEPTKWLDKEDFIPFRDISDNPVVPIIPFYYNNIPDRPLEGYSSMKRIYDQLYEMNIIRSFQANAVRKASRQWLVKKGELSSEEMAKVTSGVDGLFIEVESEESLDTIIRPVPHESTPVEVARYYQDVQNDKDKGSVVAPFTRGEVTKATATEIAALAAYTSSEIGRMARERDATIEHMASVYLCVLSVFLEEEKTAALMIFEGKSEAISAKDIMGDFRVYAADQAATPMSEAVHKQQLLANVPVLVQLGVPPASILKELVRIMDLPESFIVEQQPEQQPSTPGQAPQTKLPPDTNEMVRNPSVANIAHALPNMEA
tara:strand:+ start:9029 stop:10669 length:1641 start_codon:yes stop_codon:yes gene_type:complete